MENTLKNIVILGGMGPKASLFLENMVYKDCQEKCALSKDQDFPNLIHISLPSLFADRTGFLCDDQQENPAYAAEKILKPILEINQKMQTILAIPCNTFHSDAIYKELATWIDTNYPHHVFVHHLIDETVSEILLQDPSKEHTYGILSTQGERKTQIYGNALQNVSLKKYYLPAAKAAQMQEIIYHPTWGIKSASTAWDAIAKKISKILDVFTQLKLSRIILGCTELSLINKVVFKDFVTIDPLRILSKKIAAQWSNNGIARN